jgi:hypothetical protein
LESKVGRLTEWDRLLCRLLDDHPALTTLRSASGLDGVQPTIVHTTLFRFGVDLRDPPALLKATQSMLLDACFRVREIVVTREVLYPSIITDDMARFPLHAVTT